MDLCMPKAERAESTPSSQKAPEAGYKKTAFSRYLLLSGRLREKLKRLNAFIPANTND